MNLNRPFAQADKSIMMSKFSTISANKKLTNFITFVNVEVMFYVFLSIKGMKHETIKNKEVNEQR